MLTLGIALVLSAQNPTLAVMDLQSPGVAAGDTLAIQESLTATLSKRGFFEVISATEIRALLGVERQRQLMGCSDTSCEAELASALGARFVISGSLVKLGDSLQLSLQFLDSTQGQVIARAVRIAASTQALVGMMPWVAAEATATPAPPQPSRAMPITLIGVGAASVLTGGILGVFALIRDASLTQELSGPTPQATLLSFQEQAHTNGLLRTTSLISLAAGAALLTLGIVLLLPGADGAVSVVPTSTGMALVGAWP